VNKYKLASQVHVFYNPGNSQEAILEPGRAGGIFVPFILAAWLLMPGVISIFIPRHISGRFIPYFAPALVKAAFIGDYETITLLLSQVTDVNVADSRGVTALMWAAYFGRTEIIMALLEKGADVNIRNNNGRTALMDATERGYFGSANLLKEFGAKE
jgi:hypothetical protein